MKVKIKYLGRKEGMITKLFDDLKNWDLEKKKEFGAPLNELKKFAEASVL